MDFSTIISVVGTLATIVFGFLSIDLFRRKRYPGKITLVKQSVISLFNNIAKNFNEISIQYKAEPIKENVIYIKATFINDGDIDIEKPSIEKTIKVELEDGLKWIKSKITKSSPELSCQSNVNENGKYLEFNFGLFRKKEFLQFEALVETHDRKFQADDLFNHIKISHRIANTQKIKELNILSSNQIEKKWKKIKRLTIVFTGYFLVMIIAFFIQFSFFIKDEIQYVGADKEVYKATIKDDNVILLKSKLTNKEFSVSTTEFEEKYKPSIVQVSPWQKMQDILILIPIIIVSILLLVLIDYVEIRRANRVNNILGDAQKEDTED